MSETQEQLDQLNTELRGLSASVGQSFEGIEGDLERLEAQVEAGEKPDFTAIKATVAAFGSQVQALKDLDAERQPPVDPEPEPEPAPEA